MQRTRRTATAVAVALGTSVALLGCSSGTDTATPASPTTVDDRPLPPCPEHFPLLGGSPLAMGVVRTSGAQAGAVCAYEPTGSAAGAPYVLTGRVVADEAQLTALTAGLDEAVPLGGTPSCAATNLTEAVIFLQLADGSDFVATTGGPGCAFFTTTTFAGITPPSLLAALADLGYTRRAVV